MQFKITPKKGLLFVGLMILQYCLIGQNNSQAFSWEWGGFVRADAAYDTRLNVESREGFFIFWPKPVKTGNDGRDLNARPGFNMWAMTTRLFARTKPSQIVGGNGYAYVEGDFTGPSNYENNAFRLRHAYFVIKWSTLRVLAGQYWTPLDVPEALPRPLGLNTGAPFHSFARNPQFRLEWGRGKFKVAGIVLAQRDYASSGPGGIQPDYLRFSPLPNFHLQVHYTTENLLMGAGIDYKSLAPRLVTDSLTFTNEKVNSVSFTAFGQVTAEKFRLKFQGVYGQNLSDHLMAGGYAVETIEPGGVYKYINLNHLFSWIDATYRLGRYEVGFYGGWLKNLGTHRPAQPIFWGRGENIAMAWRAAPRVSFNIGPLTLYLEAEYTQAVYGEPDEKYDVKNTHSVGNLRLQAVASYDF
jgi:hypothetical protein